MGKWRTAIARSMCWAISSRYCGHRTMTIKGAKRNVPHLLQAQQAPICLWSISETLQCQKFRGTVTKSTVSNRVCWSLKVLWGSVSADFRQFQVGREGKKEYTSRILVIRTQYFIFSVLGIREVLLDYFFLFFFFSFFFSLS